MSALISKLSIANCAEPHCTRAMSIGLLEFWKHIFLWKNEKKTKWINRNGISVRINNHNTYFQHLHTESVQYVSRKLPQKLHLIAEPPQTTHDHRRLTLEIRIENLMTSLTSMEWSPALRGCRLGLRSGDSIEEEESERARNWAVRWEECELVN